MCEIFGLTILNGKYKRPLDKARLVTLFNNLALTASNRDHTTTGLIIANDCKFNILKKDVPIDQLVTKQVYLDFMNNIDTDSTYSVFGYNANKAQENIEKMEDCCPLVKSTTVGFIEGAVTNISTIHERFKQFEKSSKKGAEVVPDLFNFYKNTYNLSSDVVLRRLFEKIDGNLNAVLFNSLSPSSIHIFKASDSPFNMVVFEEHGIVLYASLRSFIESVTRLMELDKGTPITIPKRTGVVVCAQSNRYEKIIL